LDLAARDFAIATLQRMRSSIARAGVEGDCDVRR
jgi:hypothetical protein